MKINESKKLAVGNKIKFLNHLSLEREPAEVIETNLKKRTIEDVDGSDINILPRGILAKTSEGAIVYLEYGRSQGREQWVQMGTLEKPAPPKTTSRFADIYGERNSTYESFPTTAKFVKDSLVEYGGGSPGPMGGPMAGSQNYDSEERELVSRIGELESAIWNSGRPKLISAWDNFSDGLLSGAESMYPEDDEYENGEEIQEPYWNDLDDSDLEYAIQHAEGLLLSADLSQEQLPDNLREAKDEDGDGYCDMCGAKLKKGKCDICAGEGLGKMIDAGKKLQAKKKKLVKEYYTPEDQIDDRLAVAKEEAQKISAEEGVGQHVNEVRPGVYRVEDWFDSDATVASYENGREIG